MRKAFILNLLFFLSLMVSTHLYAQNLKTFDPSKTAKPKPVKTKQKLATEYYASQNYEKAASLFEELYEENYSSYYYRYLLYCYVQLEEYRKAEKMIKKANKNGNKSYKELADLAYIQLQKGDIEKAEKMFEEAIKELPPNKAAVNELANDFRARGQTELAEECYFAGKELLKGEYGFESELGYLYYYLEKYDLMTDVYLDLLERNPDQMKIVQFRIQNAFRRSSEDVIYPYLKDELLKRIQDQKESSQYSELLLWLSIQRKDFDIAIIQAKALDRREGSEYFRVFDLSQLMAQNGQFDKSIAALEFIVKRPDAKDQIYFQDATQALLSSKYGRLQMQSETSSDEVEKLSNDYAKTLDEMGRFRYTITTVMEYAELLSYYQNRSNLAIEELENLIANPGLKMADKAPVKLLLGDIYLLDANPWEATLLFSQVEKDFKNDEMGYEARLRNAKLSFYIGEFDWAKAQLDILKVATGKRIANDAMNLSLFISENLDADSSTRALELYGRADLLHLRNKDSLALQTLDSIFMLSLYHEIFDNVWMRQSEILMTAHQYEESKALLEKIVDQYPDGLLADDAVWRLAEIELNVFNDEEKASEWYKIILTEYPNSLYSTDARNIFRELREDFLDEDI